MTGEVHFVSCINVEVGGLSRPQFYPSASADRHNRDENPGRLSLIKALWCLGWYAVYASTSALRNKATRIRGAVTGKVMRLSVHSNRVVGVGGIMSATSFHFVGMKK
jgi:hypothetical protein